MIGDSTIVGSALLEQSRRLCPGIWKPICAPLGSRTARYTSGIFSMAGVRSPDMLCLL